MNISAGGIIQQEMKINDSPPDNPVICAWVPNLQDNIGPMLLNHSLNAPVCHEMANRKFRSKNMNSIDDMRLK